MSNKKNDKTKKAKNVENVIIAPEEIPVIVVKNLVLFPGSSMQFDLDSKRAIRAVEAAMLSDGRFFLLSEISEKKSKEIDIAEVMVMLTGGKDPLENDDEESKIPEVLHNGCIGTIAKTTQVIRQDNGIVRVQVAGLQRAMLTDFEDYPAYFVGHVEEYSDLSIDDAIKAEALRRLVIGAGEQLLREYGAPGSRELKRIRKIRDLDVLTNDICSNFPLEEKDRLNILQTVDLELRCKKLIGLLSNEKSIMNARKEISEQISRQVDEHQREYILREQLSYIQSELNDDPDEVSEVEQYKKAAEELVASDEVKAKLKKEIRHFEQNGGMSQEGAMERAYIETLLELPWDKRSEGYDHVIDIKKAKQILDRDHYGLKDVKERVLEYLAVRTLTGKSDAAILCLVGPPGTGKTSIARSVAEATEKPYVRICLGGVRDEAEIRGHRKTYVGAMPGRISAGLKSAGVKDPLMLLDEIDKMSQDYRGDTASAMLEVLDSEQNKNFRDHYVELSQDLSDVLFIATANDEEGIPRPLLDRMEIIEIAGYTNNEKFHIAKEHLVKKTYEKTGVKPSQLKIADSAIEKIIECYCREAGVRELERELSKLCRKAAVEILENKNAKKITVTAKNLEKYLGKIKFPPEQMNKKNEVGIARGLAWTSVGGTTLQVEVNILPGKGELSLTGQLGDVMKESAMAAFSYVRSVAPKWNVEKEFFQNHDIHVHLPEGAVPKDGPSAGITMATAILSAVTGKKVDRKIAMTGEISLRGNVMPVGGLKEKILAAKTIGIKTVLLPDENRRNVEEIDAEILDGMELVFVKHMDEVVERAFV